MHRLHNLRSMAARAVVALRIQDEWLLAGDQLPENVGSLAWHHMRARYKYTLVT